MQWGLVPRICLTRMKQWLTIGRELQSPVNGRQSSNMNIKPVLAVLTLVPLLGLTPVSVRAADEGVALAIIYDTSGSMKDPVRDQTGGFSPKNLIAHPALGKGAKPNQKVFTNKAHRTPPQSDTASLLCLRCPA